MMKSGLSRDLGEGVGGGRWLCEVDGNTMDRAI